MTMDPTALAEKPSWLLRNIQALFSQGCQSLSSSTSHQSTLLASILSTTVPRLPPLLPQKLACLSLLLPSMQGPWGLSGFDYSLTRLCMCCSHVQNSFHRREIDFYFALSDLRFVIIKYLQLTICHVNHFR